MKAEQPVMSQYYGYPKDTDASYNRHQVCLETGTVPEVGRKILETKKEVARQERQRVRRQEEQKKFKENQEAQKSLREQIEEKKRLIEQLEQQRKIAEEEQIRSYELAKFKEEQDRQRLKKKEQQRKINDRNAKDRAEQAFKRMLEEKQVAEAKEREAAYRRKVIQDAQRQERNRAAERQKFIEANRPEETKIPQFDQYNRPLGRVNYNRNVDYSKTCLHNPILLRNIAIDDLQQTAMDKAKQAQERIRKMREDREASQERYRQISQERGKQAARRIQQQKLLAEKNRECQEKLKAYNLQKVQQGKKDQFLGLKPATLFQMEQNKKLRSQRQFEQMFLKNRKVEWMEEPANKYDYTNQRNELQVVTKVHKVTYVNKSKRSIEQSRIPNESASKYSFNDDNLMTITSGKADNEPIYDNTHEEVRQIIREEPKRIPHHSATEEVEEPIQPIHEKPTETLQKTRAPQHPQRLERPERPNNFEMQEKSEGKSQDRAKKSVRFDDQQSQNRRKQIEQMRQFIKQNEQYLSNAQKQRRVVYKQQNSKASQSNQQDSLDYSPLVDKFLKTANQMKKPTKLSNICENRQHQSDLDYSEDSQHDN